MAGKEWSDRSGSEKKSTLHRFAIVYGVVAVVAVALGWWTIVAIFGVLALALAAVAFFVPSDAPVQDDDDTPREKPAWMDGIELPSSGILDTPISSEQSDRPFAQPLDAPPATGPSDQNDLPPSSER